MTTWKGHCSVTWSISVPYATLGERREPWGAEQGECLGLVTVTTESPEVSQDKLNEATETLKTVLKESLRRGDVFTQWNRPQMIVMLTDVQRECPRLDKQAD